ncbi:hypothetical protein GJ744_011434 [Endocarpon pusillum]|uniref:Uncharacterized protein n=1 Tax=Endocarpon pusillum TaxID=364733 RepID=A0A8H7E2W8_9EURO|nr:hypothetical protein GJ744_011434 [Endocarpon pusillum]
MGDKQALLSGLKDQAPPWPRKREQRQQRRQPNSSVPRSQPTRDCPPRWVDLGCVPASSTPQDQSSGSEWEELRPASMSQRIPSSLVQRSSPSSQNPNVGSGRPETKRPSVSASRQRRPSLSSMLNRLNLSNSLPKPDTISEWEHLQRPSPSSSLQESSPAVSSRSSSPCSSQQYYSPVTSSHSVAPASSHSTLCSSPRHVSQCRCKRCQPQLYNVDGITRKMALWRGVQCATGCRCAVCEKNRVRILRAT